MKERDYTVRFTHGDSMIVYCKVCKMNVLKDIHVHSTPDPIPSDADYWDNNEDVFVFGSNDLGQHKGGAAKAALLLYGAVMGQARGLQGSSYGIVTISFMSDHGINLKSIGAELDDFIEFANRNTNKRFWMTKIGTGISQIPLEDIKKLFMSKKFPDNVILPKEFKNF